MERKKLTLITVVSACSFVLLIVAFALIMTFCYKEKIKMSEYQPPFESYTYEGGATERIYYEEINGYKSTNMVYVYGDGKGYVKKTEKHIKSYNEVLDIDYDVYYDTSSLISSKMSEMGYTTYSQDFSETIYVVLNSKMTPIYMVDLVVGSDEEDDVMLFINLNSGEFIDGTDLINIFDFSF